MKIEHMKRHVNLTHSTTLIFTLDLVVSQLVVIHINADCADIAVPAAKVGDSESHLIARVLDPVGKVEANVAPAAFHDHAMMLVAPVEIAVSLVLVPVESVLNG